MKDSMRDEWHRLFGAALNDTIGAEEKKQLATLLKTSAEARQLWFLYHDNECSLAELKPRKVVPAEKRQRSWFALRPLAAAAAGILFGILCTSVVFAYVAPLAGKAIQVLRESFESGPAPMAAGVPVEAGRWSGDYTEVSIGQQGVKPGSGKKMLRFLRADYAGKPNADGYVADLYQLIDLRPYRTELADGGAVLQFSSGFNAFAFPSDESYGGLMSMHALDAETVNSGTLSDRQMLNAEAMAMAASSRLMLDRDPATWQRQTTELRLPPNTEFLLIHVGVTHATKPQRRAVFDGHYLDEVRLVLARRAPVP